MLSSAFATVILPDSIKEKQISPNRIRILLTRETFAFISSLCRPFIYFLDITAEKVNNISHENATACFSDLVRLSFDIRSYQYNLTYAVMYVKDFLHCTWAKTHQKLRPNTAKILTTSGEGKQLCNIKELLEDKARTKYQS